MVLDRVGRPVEDQEMALRLWAILLVLVGLFATPAWPLCEPCGESCGQVESCCGEGECPCCIEAPGAPERGPVAPAASRDLLVKLVMLAPARVVAVATAKFPCEKRAAMGLGSRPIVGGCAQAAYCVWRT